MRKLIFSIPDTAGLTRLAEWNKAIARTKALAKGAGKDSDAFKAALRSVFEGTRDGLPLAERVNTSRHIRAVLYLLLYNQEFRQLQPVDSALLNQFRLISKRLTVMSLHELISLFFIHFDKIEDVEQLGSFIRTQLNNLSGRSQSNSLANLMTHKAMVLKTDGPRMVAKRAIESGQELTAVLLELGVPSEDAGRYLALCQSYYYIDSIRGLAIGQSHPVLSEVVKSSVRDTPMSGGELVGHVVVKELIRMVSDVKETMPEEWMGVILAIAGDPRASKRSRSYMRWWSKIGEEAIVHMRRWLSRFDFRLFLEVLEEYATASKNDELQRMFPSRKVFLEGLFKQELIEDTRLFVGRRAVDYLTGNYARNELPAFFPLDSTDKSVIYLKVGSCYVIEGTHSFSIWIYDELPKGNPAQDYDLRRCSTRNLGLGMAETYWRERNLKPYNKQGRPARITHTPHKWQEKVIDALESFGVEVDAQLVLSKDDYRTYKRSRGVRIRRKRYGR